MVVVANLPVTLFMRFFIVTLAQFPGGNPTIKEQVYVLKGGEPGSMPRTGGPAITRSSSPQLAWTLVGKLQSTDGGDGNGS
jgi:hypothetical protein